MGRLVEHNRAAVLQKNTRQASALRVGGFRPAFDSLASNICRAPVGLAGRDRTKPRSV